MFAFRLTEKQRQEYRTDKDVYWAIFQKTFLEFYGIHSKNSTKKRGDSCPL